MGIFNLFFNKNNKTTTTTTTRPDIFEKELLQLELRITREENNLNKINKKLNQTQLKITIYSIITWLIYTIIWYLNLIPTSKHFKIQSLPILFFPFLLISFRWIFQTYYRRKEEISQIELRLIKKQLRDKVEEVKKKTAYYSTKELLERYDDSNTNSALTPNHPGRMGHNYPPMVMLQQRNRISSSSSSSTNMKENNPTIDSPHQGSPAQPLITASPNSQDNHHPSSFKRGWADRVAEALLGNDESSPQSQFALICSKCFAHNGLVRKEELDFIKYICPKCGTLNLPRNPKLKKKEEGSKKEESQPEKPEIGGRKSLGVMRLPDDKSQEVMEKKRATSCTFANPSASSSSNLDHHSSNTDSLDNTHHHSFVGNDVDNEEVEVDTPSPTPVKLASNSSGPAKSSSTTTNKKKKKMNS